MEQYHGTTILSVRRGNIVAMGGDGQVTLGNIVIKATAKKVRRLYQGRILAGFAGGTADAFTLFERFEAKLEKHQGNLVRSAVELAKDWRSDRALRRLEAMLSVADRESSLIITGNGDVLEPEHGIVAIGSGGTYAQSAARALLENTELPPLDMPVAWSSKTFVPFDWGYLAFVYDETKLPNPPKSFTDLIASDTSVVILDPRSSTPGLGLLLWIKNAYGDRAPEIWKGLAPRIVTVAPGWSEGYGLFLSGEVDMALAYTTSPAYHQIAEQDATKRAAIFEEGNYTQIEVAAMTAHSDQPELAKQFLAFMLSDDFQSVIPTTTVSSPVRRTHSCSGV